MTTEELLGHELSTSHAELLELTFDAILVRDFDTDVIRYWNRGAEQLYGYPREEALGHVSHDVLQTIHPSEIKEAKAILVRTGRWEGELVHTKSDGTKIIVLSRWALQTVDGEPSLILETNTDITERIRVDQERTELLQREHQARMEAQEAERRLKLLAEASALLASSLDYETTLKSLANAVVPAIADWAAVDLLEEDGSVRRVAVIHEDPKKLAAANRVDELAPYNPDSPIGVPNVLRTGQPELMSHVPSEFFESLIESPELLKVVLEIGLSSWMIVPLAARGRILGTLTLAASESGNHYGQEDLALAEVLARRAALAVDNARLYHEAQRVAGERSAILSQMSDGLIICDMTSTVTFVNEAAKRIYGRDFVGRTLDEYRETAQLITDGSGDAYRADDLPLQRALSYGEVTIDAEARLHRPDGSEVIIERSATPIIAPNETQVGAILVIRDVTAQRTLERQKEQFLSAAAHDLKTPLTSLMGMSQILQRRIRREEHATPEELLEGLSRIERNASRMTSLINELLDLSQLEMGQVLELHRQPTDLVALTQASVNALSANASGRQLAVEAKSPSIVGNWDGARLERVIGNLVSNAIKYSPEGSAVSVSIGKESGRGEDWAVLAVRDEGIGIPQEDLTRIFDRFHRGRNVASAMLGTGIGLAAARQIIEQHGGTISVESEEGKGSTFIVRLPLNAKDHEVQETSDRS